MERVCAYRTPSAADRHPLPGGHAAGERPRRAGSRGVVLVSACLAGVRCRYDGGACPDPAVVDLVRRGRALPVCPEQLGGLPTPRRPAEIRGGAGADVLEGRARVVTASGADVTDAFLRGAEETLRLARLSGAEGAILKARSPSCGVGAVYDGSFTGRLRPGDGVAAALLRRAGITLRSGEPPTLPHP